MVGLQSTIDVPRASNSPWGPWDFPSVNDSFWSSGEQGTFFSPKRGFLVAIAKLGS